MCNAGPAGPCVLRLRHQRAQQWEMSGLTLSLLPPDRNRNDLLSIFIAFDIPMVVARAEASANLPNGTRDG